ncbi:MAG: hypothetical protein KF836_13080 [Fimbriimonadaceae bacterium]|nr:hypothetical protein [Fimbriimonadaceae bacterium]
MARLSCLIFLSVLICGCTNSPIATAIPAPEVPELHSVQKVPGTKMSFVLPDYLKQEMGGSNNFMGQLYSQLMANESGSLFRFYEGPDINGKDCMIMMTAFTVRGSGGNPEGSVNEMVDMMSGFGMTGGEVSKSQVELPIGKAFRGVIAGSEGGQSVATILYAGEHDGHYYQVMFFEVGSGDIQLTPDEQIMESLRFE